jgi:hypothetical protein
LNGVFFGRSTRRNIDMSWNPFSDIVTAFENEKIKYSFHFD